MTISTYLRLGLLGSRVDALRVVLTAAGSALATLAVLAAATVAAIGPGDGPYSPALLDQPGLRPGVIITLVLMCVPVFVLLAQCSRIGTPAHHRRLAALRLAGASPRQVTRLVSVGAGLGASVGALAGLMGFLLVHGLFDASTGIITDRGDGFGPRLVLRLPTDVLPKWWVIVLAVVLVPVLVVGATAWSLRRVVVTPFGVLRHTRARPPRVVPAIATVVGVASFFVVAAVLQYVGNPSRVLIFASLFAGLLLAAGGLLAGQGAVALSLGRWLTSHTSRPSLLLAGRRMMADPFAATRSTAVLTVAVLVAAGAQQLRRISVAGAEDNAAFYRSSYDLVDLTLVLAGLLAALGLLVASAEGVVARRRTYAAVVAAGMPRGVVARSVLAELLLPLVPSLLAAAVVGTVAATGLFGRTVERSSGTVTVGVAWTALLVILAAALAVTALTTATGLLFLRRATDIGELRAAA